MEYSWVIYCHLPTFLKTVENVSIQTERWNASRRTKSVFLKSQIFLAFQNRFNKILNIISSSMYIRNSTYLVDLVEKQEL